MDIVDSGPLIGLKLWEHSLSVDKYIQMGCCYKKLLNTWIML